MPYPLAHLPYRNGYDKVVLWYGRSNVSPLHFDPNSNFMHQLDGQKRAPSLGLITPTGSQMPRRMHPDRPSGLTACIAL